MTARLAFMAGVAVGALSAFAVGVVVLVADTWTDLTGSTR